MAAYGHIVNEDGTVDYLDRGRIYANVAVRKPRIGEMILTEHGVMRCLIAMSTKRTIVSPKGCL